MKIYLLNIHWFEGHNTIGAFKNREDAQNLIIQMFMNESRVNVSSKKIVDICFKQDWKYEIEEIELE